MNKQVVLTPFNLKSLKKKRNGIIIHFQPTEPFRVYNTYKTALCVHYTVLYTNVIRNKCENIQNLVHTNAQIHTRLNKRNFNTTANELLLGKTGALWKVAAYSV